MSYRTEYDAIELKLERQRSSLAIITGEWNTANLFLSFAKKKAAQLALSSPFAQSEILITIIGQIFLPALAAGLKPEYVMERTQAIQTIEELRAMAIRHAQTNFDQGMAQ